MTTEDINAVNISSSGTITAEYVDINDSLNVEEDIILNVERSVFFSNDGFNKIKASSTDVTGGGILVRGYDTARL